MWIVAALPPLAIPAAYLTSSRVINSPVVSSPSPQGHRNLSTRKTLNYMHTIVTPIKSIRYNFSETNRGNGQKI